MSLREQKKKILCLLNDENFEDNLDSVRLLPARQVVNPLFSCIYSTDDMVKWRAVTTMGIVVAHLADHDIESAREVVRRLVWNMNDESGVVGWGSPEAMGDITARHDRLADEFGYHLVTYLDENGNYVSHPALQKGALWGLGRLARVRPRVVEDAIPFLKPFIQSQDATIRGLAVWAAGALGADAHHQAIEGLVGDANRIQIFIDGRLETRTVGQLAKQALSR